MRPYVFQINHAIVVIRIHCKNAILLPNPKVAPRLFDAALLDARGLRLFLAGERHGHHQAKPADAAPLADDAPLPAGLQPA